MPSIRQEYSFVSLSRYIPRALVFLASMFLSPMFPSASAADRDPSTWTWNNPKDLGIDGLEHRQFHSESMDRTVGYQIYVPPEYQSQPSRRFPVVYFLHGAGGNESSDAGLAARVHAEILAGRIQPTIYVFPNGGKRSGYRDWKESYVRSETMLIKELGRMIDREYRTINHPGARALCGFSMGGGGAIRLMLKYPERFGVGASLAAALDVSSDSAEGDNCYAHASALGTKEREGLRLYLVIGDEDFLYPRHNPFLQHLKKLGIAYTEVVHSQVSHNLGKLSELSAESMIRFLDRQIQIQP